MARKLMVSDTVQVPVTVVVAGKTGKAETHKFSLTCRRMSGEELNTTIHTPNYLVNVFLAEITTGWSGQRLVMEDDDKPSEFSADAFADLLSIAGVPALCLQAYLKEVVAKEKN